MSDRFKIRCGVYAVMQDEDKFLLSQYSTGIFKGKHNFPAGHMDGNESPRETLARELMEELGIVASPQDMRFAHLAHRRGEEVEYIDIFFQVDKWTGTPRINELDKCSDLGWYSVEDMQALDMVYYIPGVLKSITFDTTYSEVVWDC